MKNLFSNPVLWIDLRSRLRERRLWILALFMALVPATISLLFLGVGWHCGDPYPTVGMALSGIAVFSHGALLVLLSALGAAGRISQERERRTLPALVNSPLSAGRIANGKLAGAWIFSAWLSCTTLPFLAVAALWGGLSPLTLFLCWLLNTAAAMAAASLALGLSGLFGRSLSAYLATGAVLFLWCAVLPIIGLFLMDGASSEVREYVLFPVFYYHIPLVPQIMLFGEFLDPDNIKLASTLTALAVWTCVALLGRHLARRGLSREVY